jgi:hypothetical protein
MDTPGLQAANDLSAAKWVAARLGGAFGAVTRTVPGNYPAYARICHPALDETGAFVTWTQVAEETGRRPHPLMQWHALIGSSDAVNPHSIDWPGSNPTRGNLEPEALAPLCDVLGQHTETPQECYFCLWEGYGWMHGTYRQTFMGTKQVISPSLPQEVLDADRVQHPSRTYLLLTGILSTAMQLTETVGQSPNIFWPADRAWCVASEIDFDSTLVAGSEELINALLDDPVLDAWRVRPTDSLAYDADVININS